MTNHMRTTVLRSVLAVLAVYLWGVTLSDRADAAVIPKSGNVSGETWTGGDTYHVTGDLTVNDGTTLTVQTGAVVKFDPNLQLKVFGKLDGDGISENPVIFTSRDDDILGEIVPASDGVPAPGDWFGIWLEGSGVNDGIGELEFCHIRYGGNAASGFNANLHFDESNSGHFTDGISEFSAQDGVSVFNCAPAINNSMSTDNANHGLFASGGNAAPTVTNNTFMNNGGFGAKLDNVILTDYAGNMGSGNGTNGLGVSGTVATIRVWSSTVVFPFVITSSVTVNDGTTLTLVPGAIVKGGTMGQIKVLGKLDADGTVATPVVFTSLQDDSFGGDTNNDGANTVAAAGDWDGIWLEGQGSMTGLASLIFATSDMEEIPLGLSRQTCISTNRIPGILMTASVTSAVRMAYGFSIVRRQLIVARLRPICAMVYSHLEPVRRLLSSPITPVRTTLTSVQSWRISHSLTILEIWEVRMGSMDLASAAQ